MQHSFPSTLKLKDMAEITPESLIQAGFTLDLARRMAWGVYVRDGVEVHHTNGNKTVHRITIDGVDINFSPPLTSMERLNEELEAANG